MKGRGLFVIGTDTGVGKTIVTGGLAAALREQGVNVGVIKPVETGCLQDDGSFFPADARFLKVMAGSDLPLDVICPFQFKEPLAPSVAAEREGTKIELDLLIKTFEQISAQHQFTLVEGAGGVMVPLSQTFLLLDLVKSFKLPVLIVSRAELGTINHTLLTLRALQAEQVPMAGIVINNFVAEKSIASETNPAVIARLAEVPVWGTLPYHSDLNPQYSGREIIIELIQAHLNLEPLYHLIGNENSP